MRNNSLNKLVSFIEGQNFRGYDPYDALNARLNFNLLGKTTLIGAIQLQKRNPVNIRWFLGIKKDYNPKGMGLFLKAYCNLYRKTQNPAFLNKAVFLFEWLCEHYSKGYSGHAWGYNFNWASSDFYLPAFSPSVVVTSFVIDGIFHYYQITNDKRALDIINSAAQFIMKDIPVNYLDNGLVFSYSTVINDCCYNASLLAAEVLAKADALNKTKEYTEIINSAIDFVLSRQRPDGEWWYSCDLIQEKERRQIDFHQGFMLVSLSNLNSLLPVARQDVNNAIVKGVDFYRKMQFFDSGQSLWRLPRQWPTDIHSQSQGIITFSKLKDLDRNYLPFAKKIAAWTITHMQDKKGYFYFRKYPWFTNRIPYIRWGQAWMMLALSELFINEE
jgi:hypothetical protein